MTSNNFEKCVLLLGLVCAAEAAFSQTPARSHVLPKGTRLETVLLQGLSSQHTREGEQFAATLASPVAVEGQIVLPVGTRLMGTVSRVKRPGRFRGKAEISLCFDSVKLPDGRLEPVVAMISRVERPGEERVRLGQEGEVLGRASTGRDTAAVLGGGAAGAGIGAVAGGGKGAAIGGAAGSLLGLAGVFWSRGEDVHLPAQTLIEVVLEKPLTLGSSTAPDRPPGK